MLLRLIGSLLARHERAASVSHAIALAKQGKLAEAEVEYRRACASGKDGAAAYHGLGKMLVRQAKLDEGVEALSLAVELEPDNADYRLQLGFALANANLPGRSLPHLREGLRLRPDVIEIEANLHKPLLDVCAWDELDRALELLMHRTRRSPPEYWTRGLLPYPSLFLSLPGDIRRQAARHFAARVERGARADAPLWRVGNAGSRPRDRRIRLAYLSADLRNHATSHLMAGLFEQHDRRRFELFAYSTSPDDGSAYRRRVAAAFDHFVELRRDAPAAVARRIAADGIQVLVDLNGYCKGGFPKMLALRPAPLQVNFLGYPGSMQAAFMDYVIADRIVLPQSDRSSFSEAVAWMPAAYQPNDDRQEISAAAPTRSECGLPADAMVYCSFNHPAKIERQVFAAWMRILKALPASVLWLYAAYPEASSALSAAAERAGVDPARLVFAPTRAKHDHLARYRLADLILDTHTCGAHTTASDALWAGVPLLSWPGESFAGRVSASLLHAIGLPELVVPTLEEYEETAIALARERPRLLSLRRRLQENRASMPLFRTLDYTRHLESAFEAMWERHRKGNAPQSFAVA